MAMTQEQIMSGFGLTQTEQTNTEPQQTETTEAQQQEPETLEHENQAQTPAQEAPAAEEDEEDPGADGQGHADEDPDEEDPSAGKEGMSPEQRKANAARRRKAEQQAAIDAAVAKARQEEIDKAAADRKKFFESAGLQNTFTGKPITNDEEFQNFQRQFQTEQARQALAKGELTPEIVDSLISQNATVQQAAAIVAADQQKQVQQQEQNAQIQSELAAIQAIDPTATGLDAIMKGPYAEGFQQGVKEGKGFLVSFVEAREQANAARLAEKAQVARQNNARGKSHLKSATTTGGTGPVPVPADMMRNFRNMNPKWTDAEITAYYNKHMKK